MYKKEWYLKQKHLGCTKSARPIRSSDIAVLATKRFDIRVGQEATNYYYSKISCNLIIITAKTQLWLALSLGHLLINSIEEQKGGQVTKPIIVVF